MQFAIVRNAIRLVECHSQSTNLAFETRLDVICVLVVIVYCVCAVVRGRVGALMREH